MLLRSRLAFEAKAETVHDEHVIDSPSVECVTDHISVSPAKSALILKRKPSQTVLMGGERTDQGTNSARDANDFMEGQNNKIAAPEDPQDMYTHSRSEGVSDAQEMSRSETAQAILSILSPTKLSTPQRKATTAASSPDTPLHSRSRSLRKSSYKT